MYKITLLSTSESDAGKPEGRAAAYQVGTTEDTEQSFG